jgi:hypothetical protein
MAGEDPSNRIVNGGEVKSVTFAPDLSVLANRLKGYPNKGLFQGVQDLTIMFTARLTICQFDGALQRLPVPFQQTGLVSPELKSATEIPIYEYFHFVIYKTLGKSYWID